MIEDSEMCKDRSSGKADEGHDRHIININVPDCMGHSRSFGPHGFASSDFTIDSRRSDVSPPQGHATVIKKGGYP